MAVARSARESSRSGWTVARLISSRSVTAAAWGTFSTIRIRTWSRIGTAVYWFCCRVWTCCRPGVRIARTAGLVGTTIRVRIHLFSSSAAAVGRVAHQVMSWSLRTTTVSHQLWRTLYLLVTLQNVYLQRTTLNRTNISKSSFNKLRFYSLFRALLVV